MKTVTVSCSHCDGRGRIELTGVYAETLDLLRRHGQATGAELCRIAECKATAMNNRLAALEKHGLAVSFRWGRYRYFKAK